MTRPRSAVSDVNKYGGVVGRGIFPTQPAIGLCSVTLMTSVMRKINYGMTPPWTGLFKCPDWTGAVHECVIKLT